MNVRDDHTVDLGVTRMRPMSDPGALRRGSPFVAVALAAVLVELMTPTSASHNTTRILTATVMTVVMTGAVVIPWGRLPAWCEVGVPLSFFVVVALLRHANGGATAGYPPLVMLPVIWFALYGSRTHLWLAVLGMATTLMAPLVLIGPPMYPGAAWTTSLLSVVVAALGGPAVQVLIKQNRQRTADVAALGAITRALTAESDARAELCAAARLVTGATFATIFEPADDGMLVATAGTAGLALDLMRIDPCKEQSGTAEAWRTETRIYIADAAHDSRVSSRLTTLTGAVSILFEPVTRNGHRTAVLVVGFSASHARLPAAALDMVELVAAEIAAALYRADLVERLAVQARTDPLTGAANRRSWDDALERELARSRRSGEPLCVAMLDMDHFKAYNDACGHSAGDDLLRELVTAIRGELRTQDVISRWGGEEFAVALPVCDLAQARAIATRLLGVIPGSETASIGVTQAARDDTPRTLISRADSALYSAKRRGRNRVETLPAPAELVHTHEGSAAGPTS